MHVVVDRCDCSYGLHDEGLILAGLKVFEGQRVRFHCCLSMMVQPNGKPRGTVVVVE